MRAAKARSLPLITLTTDFGLKDGFVGVMKGVIWGICPQARIADISHDVRPQNVLEAALILSRAYAYFPSGTVHLAVVDPGVGTDRRPLALRAGDWYFVGPDNGLFTPVLEQAERKGLPAAIVVPDEPRYWLTHVSPTFHGRDVFAPLAAHLARGVPLADLGPVAADPVRLQMPRPERTDWGWRAHVMAADAFGNLATDLPVGMIERPEAVRVRLGRHEVRGLSLTYGDRPPGQLIALADSSGRLEIAVVGGSAAQLTGARHGDEVEIGLE
jgi:S-adenosylmethionine hydrolase